jgi:hypothetical protein
MAGDLFLGRPWQTPDGNIGSEILGHAADVGDERVSLDVVCATIRTRRAAERLDR